MAPTYHVFIGWDHAVYTFIQDLIIEAVKAIPGVSSVKTFGPRDISNRVDYPDVATEVCTGVASMNAEIAANKEKSSKEGEEAAFGILICGTGIGMSIAANKFSGIRAAL